MVRFLRNHRSDVLGVGWIVLLAILLLSPAVKDGHNFGPTDLGTGLSPALTAGSVPSQPYCLSPSGAVYSGCPHDNDNGDIINQAVPWNTADWQLVHHGQFPLWESNGGTGEPLLLNFESSVLALPTLVGYLFPLSWSFLVTMFVKLLIAGLGAYWCCRVLGSRASAAAVGGSSFMFSGSIAGWLGWSITGPLVWTGAIVAAAILSYRRRRAAWPPLALAIAVAFAIFGGFPEDYALLAIALAALLAGAALTALATRAGVDLWGALRLVAGVVGGLGLSAVLWLPGLSVIPAAVRGSQVAATGLPIRDAELVIAPGYNGLPTAGSYFFGKPNYFETAASVALVAVALAVLAVIVGRRRIAVVALAAMGAVSFLLAYRLGPVSPVQRLAIDLGLKTLNLGRAVGLLGFAIAVLGGIGAEIALARSGERGVRIALTGAVGLVVAAVAVLGVRSLGGGLVPPFAHLRREAMLWPAGTALLLILIVVVIFVAHRGRAPGGASVARALAATLPFVLVGVASAAGLFAEVGINSYSHMAYPKTAATDVLTAEVGSALLGIDGGNSQITAKVPLGFRTWPGVGFYPNMNTAYGIDELALHDPTVSADYFASWPVPNSDGASSLNLFVPDVDTVPLARRYGVGYILSYAGAPSIPGTTRVATIGGERLSKVPDSGRFTVAGTSAPLAFTHPDDATYIVDTTGHRGSLTARITASPGWHATGDGRALSTTRVVGATSAKGVFLAVTIPPGAASVTFHYTPPHLDIALALTAAVIVSFVVAELVRRRRRPTAS